MGFLGNHTRALEKEPLAWDEQRLSEQERANFEEACSKNVLQREKCSKPERCFSATSRNLNLPKNRGVS